MMTALTRFSFDEFLLRPAGTSHGDLRLAENWTAWDAAHAGIVDPGFWLEQRPGVDSYLVQDKAGPLFFFKTIQMIVKHDKEYMDVVELHIQFMPLACEVDRNRTRTGLEKGFQWLERVLRGNNIAEVFFDSKDVRLIAFCVKRLGFEQRGERLTKRLIPCPVTA